jgi:hypothetical protein
MKKTLEEKQHEMRLRESARPVRQRYRLSKEHLDVLLCWNQADAPTLTTLQIGAKMNRRRPVLPLLETLHRRGFIFKRRVYDRGTRTGFMAWNLRAAGQRLIAELNENQPSSID